MGDVSLILGTVLSQLCIGTFIATFVVDYFMGKADKGAAFYSYLAAFISGVVGLGAMILHLGHPFLAFNAFFNLGRSWLSREVLFYGGFLGVSFLFLVCLKLKKEGVLKPLGILACLLGVCAVFVTSMIYTIPSIPAWYSANTPISFALTAVMLGVSLAVLLCKPEGMAAGGAKLVGAVAILAFISTLIYVSTLAGGNYAAAGSAYLITQDSMYLARMAILGIVGIYAIYAGIRKRDTLTSKQFTAFFALLLISEFLGRILFFGTIVRL
ncbi:MAG: dimethyl sulfoxide reductase anchor subunit family protein [Lachnospiraceae bacterium]